MLATGGYRLTATGHRIPPLITVSYPCSGHDFTSDASDAGCDAPRHLLSIRYHSTYSRSDASDGTFPILNYVITTSDGTSYILILLFFNEVKRLDPPSLASLASLNLYFSLYLQIEYEFVFGLTSRHTRVTHVTEGKGNKQIHL